MQGNPWLANGPARVILNEITSGNPMQLRGAIEVGGQKAEVVIANPAGIAVDGGGFILANAGGLYGGPKIVQLRGTLERRGEALAVFTAQRQMFMYFGLPRSTCSMVGVVTYALGGDIAEWLQQPIDGVALGEF